MSMKCDNRSLYPYAVGVAAGARMLPYGVQYDTGDGDACSWRSNVDNEYAYVDELLPPPSPPPHHPSASRHQSPLHHYTATTNNNNAYAPRARQSTTPDHVTGCLLACRQYDEDRPRVDAGNN